MSLIDGLSLSVYALATAALGHLLLRLLYIPSQGRDAATAYLAGQLGWLLLFLIIGTIGIPADRFVFTVSVIALVGCVVVGGREGWLPFERVSALHKAGLLLLVCSLSFPNAIYLASRVPLVDWDARSIWFFHGKAIWIHNGIVSDFFANPHHAWSHTDYPLLLPVQAAVVAAFRGSWSEMAVKSFLGLNFLAYFWILLRLLLRRGWQPIPAMTAAVLLMGISLPRYFNGYADIHYAMPLTLALLLCFSGPNYYSSGSIAVLLACYGLNLKNESAMYVVLGSLVFVIAMMWRRWRSIVWQKTVPVVAMAGFLGLLPALLWMGYKHVFGLEGDIQLSRHIVDPGAAAVQCMMCAPYVLEAMRFMYYRTDVHHLVGIVALLTFWHIVLQRRKETGRRVLLTREEQALWLAVLVVNLLMLLIYGLTPYDYRWHIGTSLDRLLVFPKLLIAALILCGIEKCFQFRETDC